MSSIERIAGAPISWGVCEVPGWGYQLPPDRVLAEMRELAISATEAGPEGYLGSTPESAAARLRERGMNLVGGFVPAPLHLPGGLKIMERNARLLASAGADVLVLAATGGESGYDETPQLSNGEWPALLVGLDQARAVCEGLGLRCSLHPHVGTVIERAAEIERVLGGSTIELCVDTGHLLIGGSDPVRLVREVPKRVSHVHLKDVDATLAEAVRNGDQEYSAAIREGLYRPLGGGSIDVATLVSLLEDAGYRGWYVLEQDVVLDSEPPSGAGPGRDVRASVAFLRSVLDAPGQEMAKSGK
jgi:inosose dehydratase